MPDATIALDGAGLLHDALRTRLLAPDAPDTPAARPDLVVTAADGYDPLPERPAAAADGAAWLPLHVDLGTAVIGPAALPGRPGCPRCAHSRADKAQADNAELRQVRAEFGERLARPDIRLTAPATAAVAELVAGEAARIAADRDSHTVGGLIRVRLDDLATSTHRFLPEPDCPQCGGLPPDSREAAEFTPHPHPKLDPDTHRVRALDADLLLDTYVDSHVGLIRATQRTAYRTYPTIAAPMGVRVGADQTEMGFGRDLDFDTCAVTAIAEAVERYGGMRPGGRRTVVHASHTELAADALDPRTLGLYPDDRYEIPGFPYRKYDPDEPRNWVWGYSFARGAPMLVPESCAYYRLHEHGGGHDSFVYEISNGCALGGCLEEAVLHGILELAERDAFLLSWYARLPVPELDVASARSPRLRLMAERIGAQTGYTVRAFDITTENGIPAAAVFGVRDGDGLEAPKLMCAAGSAFTPEKAIANAMLELAPLLEWRTAEFEAELPRIEAMVADPFQVRTMHDHSLVNAHPKAFPRFDHLFARGDAPVGIAESYAGSLRARGEDIAGDLATTVEVFLARGMDVVMVDQTTDEHRAGGLACVKVLIPGLLPMTFGHWSRRVDGLPRLFDVPVELGHRDTPLRPEEVNPHPHPFP